MRVLDANAMREVDRIAVEKIGIPSVVLMENAAIGLVDAIGERYPEAMSAAIFCGPGNNGGDGLALARHLSIRGYQIEINLVTGDGDMRGDALVQLDICRNSGLAIQEFGPEDSIQQSMESASRMDLVVDALFGTGLTRPLAGHFAEAVQAMNVLSVPCVAVDLPSGLNASSAEYMGPHVQSEITVTFAAPKIAHILLPAAEAAGEVVVADLGIPVDLIENASGHLHLLTKEDLTGLVAPRPVASHKGDYGHALIVAGSMGKAGAAILAARGAVRSGAGLVTVATPESIAQTVDLGSVESMTIPLTSNSSGGLGESNAATILDLAMDKQVLAVGPGLGTELETVEIVRSIVEQSKIPVVLDADGLNCFVGATDLLASGGAPRVLTPHPGELARLLGVTVQEIQVDRMSRVQEGARCTRSVMVLKGNQTLIADPEGSVFVNTTGNPGMATGGAGDVLTGIIAGLICQGHDASTAACLGVFVHGVAGDISRAALGEASLTAADLLADLPEAIQQLQP